MGLKIERFLRFLSVCLLANGPWAWSVEPGATFTALDGNSDNSIHSVIVDCQKTERYLKIAGTSPTTSTVMLLAGICILSGAVDSVWIGTNGVDASVEAVAP